MGWAVGWSRRDALGLALAAGVTGLAGCRPSADRLPDDDRFPRPEQTAALFADGSRHQLDNGDWVTATTKPAGTLHMPTGRLIAVDPSWLGGPQAIGPYTVTVPPGSYPVSLALVKWDHWRVAAARLTVRKDPVQSWEMALLPGQNAAALPSGQAYNVGVDDMTMAFLDAAALTTMVRLIDSERYSFVPTAADQPYEVPGTGSNGNLIGFATGYGDGGYPVWIGRTAGGAVACFMADMAMLRRTD